MWSGGAQGYTHPGGDGLREEEGLDFGLIFTPRTRAVKTEVGRQQLLWCPAPSSGIAQQGTTSQAGPEIAC